MRGRRKLVVGRWQRCSREKRERIRTSWAHFWFSLWPPREYMPFVCILLAKTRALAPENTPTPGARAREILLLLPEFKNEKKKKDENDGNGRIDEEGANRWIVITRWWG